MRAREALASIVVASGAVLLAVTVAVVAVAEPAGLHRSAQPGP